MKTSLNSLFAVCLALLSFTSCSETNWDTDALTDWKTVNDAYWDSIQTVAAAQNWKVIEAVSGTTNTQKVYVEKIYQEGAGESVLYTDSVHLYYKGVYYNGVKFDASVGFPGGGGLPEANIDTYLKSAASGFVVGFTRALQSMKVGGYWRIHIPYELGYGTAGSGTIPGYSTLTFDIYVVNKFPIKL